MLRLLVSVLVAIFAAALCSFVMLAICNVGYVVLCLATGAVIGFGFWAYDAMTEE